MFRRVRVKDQAAAAKSDVKNVPFPSKWYLALAFSFDIGIGGPHQSFGM